MTTSIHEILGELYHSATDERDKCDKFERLMASYLRTDVAWSARFSEVWLWQDWPDRKGKADTDTDLVAQERESGELTAIQCSDPNDWATAVGDPRYILDVLKRIVTVNVETVRIVKSLPPLVIAEKQ